ncbi:MAG: response regulator [Pseudomonadota bacterium]
MLLIVDDEESIRDSLAWLAQSCGISATTYSSSADFLDGLQSALDRDLDGSCALLDVRMPGMSGVALFDLLATRQLTQVLPVIFLTGHGDVPMAADALKRGAFGFFEKPFNDNKLMDRVQEAIASSKMACGAATSARLRLSSFAENMAGGGCAADESGAAHFCACRGAPVFRPVMDQGEAEKHGSE